MPVDRPEKGATADMCLREPAHQRFHRAVATACVRDEHCPPSTFLVCLRTSEHNLKTGIKFRQIAYLKRYQFCAPEGPSKSL